jgi:hypothetical protein
MMNSPGKTKNLSWWSHPQYARDGDTLKTLVGMGHRPLGFPVFP